MPILEFGTLAGGHIPPHRDSSSPQQCHDLLPFLLLVTP
jgi:hypothetical protein